ncbi:hypothetical protein [Sphingobacterium mizutaii]|nr:hypothetical protein [Sphingobacterium mizutaii]
MKFKWGPIFLIELEVGLNQDWVRLRSPDEDGRMDQDYGQFVAGKTPIL